MVNGTRDHRISFAAGAAFTIEDDEHAMMPQTREERLHAYRKATTPERRRGFPSDEFRGRSS